MKKVAFILVAVWFFFGQTNAQKVAVIDMDYVLKSIPQHEAASDQISQLSERWQKDVEAIQAQVQTLYKNYQTELVFLSAEMKKQREDEIIAKEREANELKKRYFGPEGELFKKREALIKPIQDEIYNAIQEYSSKYKNELIVLDKNSNVGIIFASPKLDISDEILNQLGIFK